MTERQITFRAADASHAPMLDALIKSNLKAGHLLPRTLAEIEAHAHRFVIAVRGRRIVGCADLAPLSEHTAEIRSLAVAGAERHHGIGTKLVEELQRRAAREGFERLCAFTHAPGYFIRMGFSIVPHLWVREKVFSDCVKCPRFRQCGQYAVVRSLEAVREAQVSSLSAVSLV